MKYKILFLLIASVYLVLFFAAPFEPYCITGEADYPRYAFFSYLLLPDEFFSSWLGANGEFGIADRLPILGYALLTAIILAVTVIPVAVILRNQTIAALFDKPRNLTIAALFNTPRNFMVGALFDTLRHLMIAVLFGKQRNRTITALFVFYTIFYVFASAIPSTDYDVLSYHLAGAREFYEAGCIKFLPHNVYANMPFGSEMLYCWGMFLTGDTFIGALVGKVLIALTTLITAAGLYFFCKRFVDETSGAAAALLYLTNPWVFYVSTSGLNDAVLGMFAFFALYMITFFFHTPHVKSRLILFLLCGLFAGCAAGCKYTAVVFVVIPLVLLVVIQFYGVSYRGKYAGFCCSFLALFFACGFWYIKNWYYTGNPVYPLCWSIFGDSSGTWNAAVNARWTAAHSPHSFGFITLLHDIYRIGLSSAWNSPLLVPLALIAVFTLFLLKKDFANERFSGQIVFILSIYVLFFFAVWWGFTHRLERFFVPAIPFLTVIAGIGASRLQNFCGRKILITLLLINSVYCFIVCGVPAPGKLNRFLAPLETLRQDPNCYTPWAVWFNSQQQLDGGVLLVGEAKAFLYDVPVLYSVCWNETPLKEIAESGNPLEEFRKRKIRYVLIDWGEIRRFQSPGNYGFTDFLQTKAFEELLTSGILKSMPPPNEDCAKTNAAVYRVK
ncbi:MAG: glycosyltransferase family 39 protein [Planctomycetaceae bacterium]|nr:glycosyltransferase family 39 protein [Planctomycetaceae bacterium]